MSKPTPNIQNLAEGGDESFRALIQAIIPDSGLGPNGKLSGQDVAKLTEKLSELVGPSAAQGFQQTRNERGELVNEEGLPIIDITEPLEVSFTRSTTDSQPPAVTVEPLIPLATLPSTTQQRLRERRNRILDLLEEEEARAEKTDKRRELESKEENLTKNEEAAAREKRDARELQKKMGRALLQNMGKAREKEEQKREAQRLLDEEADRRRSPSIKKKTVAFAEAVDRVENVEDDSVQENWGDVIPARLGHNNRPTLMSQNLLDNLPMKSSVVERVPGGQPTLPKSPRPTQHAFDSDDESDPGADSESETEAGVDDEPVLEQDEVDFDLAQHQREIALEYYRKRSTLGGEAAAAMMNHSHSKDEIPDDLPRETTKPAVSQFRASRFAEAYNAVTPTSETSSTSLAASIIPVSSAKTIQKAVRTGKINTDGKLVGGEADSASEEENEEIQEILHLLRKGEVYNLGPDGNYLHTVPSRGGNETPSASASSSSNANAQRADSLPPPSMLSKGSKFKVSRLAMGRPQSNVASIPGPLSTETLSPSVTPVSHASRSSPKLNSPELTSSTAADKFAATIHSPSPEKLSSQNSSSFSMIIDSPSFPAPHGPPSTSMPSQMVVPSPSFPPPPPPPPQASTSRPHRPPTVLASTVRESTSQQSTSINASVGTSEKKVSRFKAERM
ncbi:hypothetical protein M413DRAFT_437979 [Hebeloma cylindrosporum]|uniref:DUF3835 domain-containing protein n=1 Tax=Hebeloma cylindrosporum TaxID=76867 RepID=A0A0C2YGF9_HEBCY|nr:hypothetical protein M413DRAFT_437979 [Hebeloma cylindrosporum h7]